LIEQLSEQLSDEELFTILARADDRLETTQNAALLRRRKNYFRRFAFRILWPDLPFSLDESVQQYEARLILHALEHAGGIIRQAAPALELSYQGLQKILNNRHKDLRKMLPAIKARACSKSLAKEAVVPSVGKEESDESPHGENPACRG
jgi:hypothetical protein